MFHWNEHGGMGAFVHHGNWKITHLKFKSQSHVWFQRNHWRFYFGHNHYLNISLCLSSQWWGCLKGHRKTLHTRRNSVPWEGPPHCLDNLIRSVLWSNMTAIKKIKWNSFFNVVSKSIELDLTALQPIWQSMIRPRIEKNPSGNSLPLLNGVRAIGRAYNAFLVKQWYLISRWCKLRNGGDKKRDKWLLTGWEGNLWNIIRDSFIWAFCKRPAWRQCMVIRLPIHKLVGFWLTSCGTEANHS